MDYTVSDETYRRLVQMSYYSTPLNLIICNGMYANYHKFVITSTTTISRIPSNIGVMLA